MVLCFDIGNTHIVMGVYQKEELINKMRFSTNELLTADELGIKVIDFLQFKKIDISKIEGIIISSVVPKIDLSFKEMCKKYFNIDALFVGQGTKSGIKICLDNPKQLGADLLVGACGAVFKYGPNVMIIDMGTAMTFVYVNEAKEFLGGAIIPGIRTAFSSLIENTSLLEEVSIEDNPAILGKNTKSCIQSGMIYGWISLVEGMIERYKDNLGNFKIVITGGEARFIAKNLNEKYDVIYDEDLLLDGLKIIYEKNIIKK